LHALGHGERSFTPAAGSRSAGADRRPCRGCRPRG
jgi:hypothetical protein